MPAPEDASGAPEISVVIPCWNERATLGACLDAVDEQSLPRSRYEVIVVDGRSTDGCRELLARRRVRVLDDPRRGPAAARNVGVRAARGRIVAFTDADCVPRFDWLERIEAAFRRHDEPAGVAGALRLPRDTLFGRIEDNDARTRYRGYITSNVAYRLDVLRAMGGFDEELWCAEDFDFAWRMLDAGHRIVHDESAIVLHDPPELRDGLLEYLRKQFWYAREDIPAHVRALVRAASSREPTPGAASAITGGLDALSNAAPAALALAGLARRSPRLALAGSGLATVRAAQHAWSNVRLLGEGAVEAPAAAAVYAAKSLVRGVGTLAGVAKLAHPSAWRHFRSRGSVGFAAPEPRLTRPAPSARA